MKEQLKRETLYEILQRHLNHTVSVEKRVTPNATLIQLRCVHCDTVLRSAYQTKKEK